MQVFWETGFEPASISDLLERTGLNKGSFYNAFGGKRQLFVNALPKYHRDYRQVIRAKLEALDNPKKAIATFFDAIVADTLADQDHKGCFLFNTALAITTHDEEVKAIVTNGIQEIAAFFRRSLKVDQARLEMPAARVPEATAKALLALMVSIRVLGRGVFADAALHTIAHEGKWLIGLNHAGSS